MRKQKERWRHLPEVIYEGFMPKLACLLGFPGGSVVKNIPAVQEAWVLSMGREDSLEKEMATHSSIFACRIPWTEEPGGLQFIGL